MLISLHLFIGYFSTLLFLSKALIVTDFGGVDVANVVSSCLRAMVVPRAQADPAKVVIALLANDVIASLILLDGCGAAGAFFGVGEHPDRIFALRHLFLKPKLHLLTAAQLVLQVAALEAEDSSAFALDSSQHLIWI